MDKVVDPAAGSYFIENLIYQILEILRSEVASIEEIGGWWKIYSDHSLQQSVKACRKKRQEGVLTGGYSKVGANKYRSDAEEGSLESNLSIREADWQLLGARETGLLEGETFI